jgi:hypothetical protein
MVVAAFLLAGCFNGPAASTTVQSSQLTGNGVQAAVGQLRIENAVLVSDANTTSLVVRIFNDGMSDDALVDVAVNGVRAAFNPTPTVIPAGGSVSFGFPDLTGPNVQTNPLELSQFIPVTLTFLEAGSTDMAPITVPPTGIYEGLLG